MGIPRIRQDSKIGPERRKERPEEIPEYQSPRMTLGGEKDVHFSAHPNGFAKNPQSISRSHQSVAVAKKHEEAVSSF